MAAAAAVTGRISDVKEVFAEYFKPQ